LDSPNPTIEKNQPDASANTVALVKLITEIGPDIAEISRRLGQFKESVRYRYKEKIINNGFAIKATPNYGALGLKRLVMKVKVADVYAEIAQKVFAAMSDLCYVVAYAATVPDSSYLLHAGIPSRFDGEFRAMMGGLKGMGIFDSIEYFDCDHFRVAPMRAECFDFEHGIWDFDWSRPLPLDAEAAKGMIWPEAEFDKTDLLIVKELWKNGRQSLKDIQGSIRQVNGAEINYKTLVWHYTHHVLTRKLIDGYSIGWHGAKYDFDAEKKKLRPHGYLPMALTVKGINDQERMTLMGTLNRLPFLWSEATGRDYYAQFSFPVENTNEALEYMNQVVRPFGARATCHLLNQKEMLSFTIGHNLYDDANGRWTFEPQGVLARFDALLIKLREMGMSRS
jgi:DNA-binding Lrp family transcriptional regulator